MATVTTLNVLAAQDHGLGRLSETTLRLQRAVKSLERVAEVCDCGKAMLEVLVLLNASIKQDKGKGAAVPVPIRIVAKPTVQTAPTATHVVIKTGQPVSLVPGMTTGFCYADKIGRRFHSDEVQAVS